MEIFLFIVMLFWTVGGAILINKSTEAGGFDWIKAHLRFSWMAYLLFSTAIILCQSFVWRFVVNIHEQGNDWYYYVLFFVLGGLIFCGYFWFAGKTYKSTQKRAEKSDSKTANVEQTEIEVGTLVKKQITVAKNVGDNLCLHQRPASPSFRVIPRRGISRPSLEGP